MLGDMYAIVRTAEFEDINAIAEIDWEAFSPYGAAEKPETFYLRWRVFPRGFIVLLQDSKVVGYGCSEKWLTEREGEPDENPLDTHQVDGKIFCITAIAVHKDFRRKGYGLALLSKLIEIARSEACTKVVVETIDADGLYLKQNFKVTGSRQQRGMAVHVMALELT